MAITTVEWYNTEKTILLQTIVGDWTLDDYLALAHQTGEKLSSVHHIVDLIADLRGIRTVPTHMVSALRRSQVRNHPNLGLVLVVGIDSGFVRAMYNAFVKLTPSVKNKFQLAPSIDDAVAITQYHHHHAQVS